MQLDISRELGLLGLANYVPDWRPGEMQVRSRDLEDSPV